MWSRAARQRSTVDPGALQGLWKLEPQNTSTLCEVEEVEAGYSGQ